MKYIYGEGVKKQTSRRWLVLSLLVMGAGLYMIINVLSPAIFYVLEPADKTAKKLISSLPSDGDNRIYIPKINLDMAIGQLDSGATERTPENSNPKKGGNYVLVAQRFKLGYTPQQTKAKSPFYHLGKLNKDDDIYVDFEGQRYAYKVFERKSVASADELETSTKDNRLTLYPQELISSDKNQEVVIAKLIGKVIWNNGQPKLQAL